MAGHSQTASGVRGTPTFTLPTLSLLTDRDVHAVDGHANVTAERRGDRTEDLSLLLGHHIWKMIPRGAEELRRSTQIDILHTKDLHARKTLVVEMKGLGRSRDLRRSTPRDLRRRETFVGLRKLTFSTQPSGLLRRQRSHASYITYRDTKPEPEPSSVYAN